MKTIPAIVLLVVSLATLICLAGCHQTTAPGNRNAAAPANQPQSSNSSPAPAPKTVAFGSIEVNSTPPGARVLLVAIDEGGASEPQPRGVTPTNISRLSPGKYTVDLEKPGYRYFQKTVEVKENETVKVNASLKKQ